MTLKKQPRTLSRHEKRALKAQQHRRGDYHFKSSIGWFSHV